MINKKAFTLTELLIALTIIGAIGGLTLPSLLGNSNERMLNTKYENTKQQIQHVVTEQMITNRTKVLENTEFANAESVLGSQANLFEITTPSGCEAGTNCFSGTAWDTETYYEVDETNKTKTPKSILLYDDEEGQAVPLNAEAGNARTATFKNGALVTYYFDTSDSCGVFIMDLNGKDGPNILGNDVRGLKVRNDGKIDDLEVRRGDIGG